MRQAAIAGRLDRKGTEGKFGAARGWSGTKGKERLRRPLPVTRHRPLSKAAHAQVRAHAVGRTYYTIFLLFSYIVFHVVVAISSDRNTLVIF